MANSTETTIESPRPFAHHLKGIPTSEELLDEEWNDKPVERWAALQVNCMADTLETWRLSFIDDPKYAFLWSESAMEAAASLEVFALIYFSLKERGVAATLDRNTSQTMRLARCTSNNASVAVNTIKRYQLTALAEANDSLRNFVALEQEAEDVKAS